MEQNKYDAAITYEYEKNLYINMTNQCCNSCDFCLRNNSDGSLYADNLWYHGGEPTKEEIWEELEKQNLNRFNELVFCGYGEPACRWDDMMWLCGKIKENGSHFIRINTNGQADLITGRNAALELDGKVDRFRQPQRLYPRGIRPYLPQPVWLGRPARHLEIHLPGGVQRPPCAYDRCQHHAQRGD